MILVLLGCCLVGCQDSTVETGIKNRNYIESNGQIVYSHMDSLVTLDSKLQIEKYIKDPTYTDDGYISDFYMNDQYTYFWVYKQEGYQIYKYDESKDELSYSIIMIHIFNHHYFTRIKKIILS